MNNREQKEKDAWLLKASSLPNVLFSMVDGGSAWLPLTTHNHVSFLIHFLLVLSHSYQLCPVLIHMFSLHRQVSCLLTVLFVYTKTQSDHVHSSSACIWVSGSSSIIGRCSFQKNSVDLVIYILVHVSN